jgi:N-acetylmuramoyl-L-alanine amidase
MAAKQFLTNFRPAMLVRLQMRLEDYSAARKDSDNTTSEDSPIAVRIRDLTSQENKLSNKLFGPLTAGLDSGRVSSAEYNKTEKQLGAVREELAKLKEAEPSARGTAEQAKNDPYSVTVLTCPMSLDVELNTYRSLDTLSVILPFMDAPLEAQIIRSCMIEAFIGAVAEEDFATPGRWRLPTDKSTIVFRGYVDDWATKHDESDSTVTISARSLECLLIDAKVDATSPLFKVQKSEKISAFVNRVIASVPATSSRNGDQLKAHFFRAEGEPYLDQAMLNRVLQTAKSRAAAANTDKNKAAIITDPNLGGTDPGAVQGTGDPRLPGKIAQEMTAWDLIIQACDLVGCVPSYDPSVTVFAEDDSPLQGDYIMIRPPQTIYERVDQGTQVVGGAEDKFSRLIPNQNSSNSPSQVRFMVWGNNIKTFTASRLQPRLFSRPEANNCPLPTQGQRV